VLTKKNGFALPISWKFPEARNHFFTFISLFVVLLAIYAPSFYGEWHFDDYSNIVNNPHIQIKSFSFEEIKRCIYGLEQKRPSRPLAYLSFALNYHCNGLNEFGFHVVNFTIHYLASLFLFLFIYNTLKLPRLKHRYENIAYPIALLATFFWAIHPVFVTSVTYIVQRMASMAGMFYILSMYLYLKGRTAQKSVFAISFFAGSFLAFVGAILSKENAVMLPVSILLFDLFLIQGVNKDNLQRTFKVITLPFLVILLIGLIYTGGFSLAFGGFELRDFTMVQRLLTEPRVIIFYLSLLFYPINSRLTLLYDIDFSRTLWQPLTTAPAILLIGLLIVFALFLAKKRPLLSFCIIFYFLNHLIEGSFFSLELIYEHRNYLPAMLLFLPVAEFILYAIDYFSYKKTIQIVVALGIVIILVGLGDNTFQRNKIMASDFLLWFDNIEKSPRLSRTHANLGRLYYNYNQTDKAKIEYDKAIALNNFANTYARATQHYNLGLLYFKEKKYAQALLYFEKSTQVLPEYILNDLHIAKIKILQDKINEADQHIAAKLKKYPNNYELIEFYNFILFKQGKTKEAQSWARRYLARQNNSTLSMMIMAETCRQKENYLCAISYWKSVRLHTSARNALANLALMELSAEIKDDKMLRQEIQLLIYLKGPLNITEYIQEITKEKNLLIYIPREEKIAYLVRNSIGDLI